MGLFVRLRKCKRHSKKRYRILGRQLCLDCIIERWDRRSGRSGKYIYCVECGVGDGTGTCPLCTKRRGQRIRMQQQRDEGRRMLESDWSEYKDATGRGGIENGLGLSEDVLTVFLRDITRGRRG